MTARALRRKDLKEDEFVSTTTRVTRWLMQRRRRIGWALLGVIVVGSLIAGVMIYQQRREQQAAGLLASAMEIYRSPVVGEGAAAESSGPEGGDGAAAPTAAEPDVETSPGAPEGAIEAGGSSEAVPGEAPTRSPAKTGSSPGSASGPDSTTAMADEHTATGHRHFSSQEAKYRAAREALLTVVEDYGGTTSGKVASFYLGICEAELGNVAAAIDRFETAAADSQQLISAMALYRLGNLHLDQGDAEQAAQSFERLGAMSGEFFPRAEALMARGRAHEAAGDLRAALAAYQQVVSEHGESFSASDARQRVEEISSRLGLDPDVEG